MSDTTTGSTVPDTPPDPNAVHRGTSVPGGGAATNTTSGGSNTTSGGSTTTGSGTP